MARTLRVVTFNIRHGVGADGILDLERTARVLEDTGAQVAGLQEVDRHLGERSDYVDQAGWLARRLSMHVSYMAVIDWDPLAPGERHRQYGLALLTTFPIRRSQRTLLPQPLAREPRGVLDADLDVGDGDTLRMLVTHLQYRSQPARLAQAATIAAMVRAGLGPVVVLGDFNAGPSDPEVGLLTEELADAWALAGTGPGFTIAVPVPSTRIDYVLVSGDLTVHAATVVDSDASDHLPVVADLALPDRQGV